MKSAHQCNGTSTESKLAITQVFENYEYSILTHSELDNLNLKKKRRQFEAHKEILYRRLFISAA